MKCAAHALNLVATVDCNQALEHYPLYKAICRSAFGKAQKLLNVLYYRSTHVADAIKDELGVLLFTSVVIR